MGNEKEMFTVKAAPIFEKPVFSLMTQKDILAFYHLQMPRWLFFDSRYKNLSLEAKVVYSFLLNRFQLSRLNNWINADGEIFIIYTRTDLSEEIGISYRKAISAVRELADVCLIWERRCGRGDANQIYLARVELNEEDSLKHRSAPFVPRGSEAADSPRYAESACLESEDGCDAGETGEYLESRCAEPVLLEEISARRGADAETCFAASEHAYDVQISQVKMCTIGTSGHAEPAGQDMRNSHPNYIYGNNTEANNTEDSQSVGLPRAREVPDGLADDLDGLSLVIEGCDLWTFAPETAKVFENAIERLWFTRSYKIGNAVLPQEKVRSHLRELDIIRLQEVERKLSANTERVIKNTTAYVMAVMFNTIWEVESDVMVDPYLNTLRQTPEGG